MIHKIRRWYRDNKIKFWILAIIILGSVALIHYFNNYISTTRKEIPIGQYTLTNPTTIKSQVSVTTAKPVDKKELANANSLINNFIYYLNEGEYKNAYYMLSDECKEEEFPSEELFIENYVNRIFNEYKTYNMQNWVDMTYKIEYRDSLLDNGGKVTDNFIRDYITITDDNKLNINGMIRKNQRSKKIEYEDIQISVKSSILYMDYAIYELEITNKTKQNYNLDFLSNPNNVYIEDRNSVRYYAYTNEINESDKIIHPYMTKALKIKFISTYSTDKQISNIVLKNMLIDGEYTEVKIDI